MALPPSERESRERAEKAKRELNKIFLSGYFYARLSSKSRSQSTREVTERSSSKIKKHLLDLDGEQSPNSSGGRRHSIFLVPRSLQILEPNVFVPHVVSIGPYHRNLDHLKGMEKKKLRLLKHVLRRTGLQLEQLVLSMVELEEETRNCYDKSFESLNKEQFAKMMLLDGCFILELLYLFAKGLDLDKQVWSSMQGFLPFIQRDLLMLENQLPLNVLVQLIAIAWDPHKSEVELPLKFFHSLFPKNSKIFLDKVAISSPYKDKEIEKEKRDKRPQPLHHLPKEVPISLPYKDKDKETKEENKDKRPKPPLHLLDIVHVSLQPSRPKLATKPSSTDRGMHSVTRLRGTNIKFEENKNLTKFTDIEYKDGKLSIPPLCIHGSTKYVFLNLMALEQYYPGQCEKHITSYVSFMDGLINSPKDVEHLIEQGIIVHELGSEEDVAKLFNNLRKEIVFDPGNSYLSDISEQLNKQYERKWRTWKATLKHEYLKDPWKIISIIAASFLILLTFAQTFYTILAYHHRPSS